MGEVGGSNGQDGVVECLSAGKKGRRWFPSRCGPLTGCCRPPPSGRCGFRGTCQCWRCPGTCRLFFFAVGEGVSQPVGLACCPFNCINRKAIKLHVAYIWVVVRDQPPGRIVTPCPCQLTCQVTTSWGGAGEESQNPSIAIRHTMMCPLHIGAGASFNLCLPAFLFCCGELPVGDPPTRPCCQPAR